MNAFEAAMGLCCLPHLHEITARRRALTWRYREQLAELPGLQFFTPDTMPGVEYNYAYLPILVDPVTFGCSRDGVWHHLQKNGVGARRYFWPAVPDYPCYRNAYGSVDVPAARSAAARVLCLPLYDSLSPDQLDRVCALLRQAARAGGC